MEIRRVKGTSSIAKTMKGKPVTVVVNCGHCGQPAALVTGEQVYPHRRDLWHKPFWQCVPCKAHVGCHPGTTHPLGSVADAELRRWRSRAHEAFDPLWKEGAMRRGQAYAWLAKTLGVSVIHVGESDIERRAGK